MKLELRENMYYRTYSGSINKIASIKDFNEREYLLNGFYVNKDTIKKASYNIIDILEVGDYVNGYKVEEVNNNLNEHKGTCNSLDTYLWVVNDLDEFEEIVIFENDIKSVITHEQMEQMSYEIEQ